MSASKLHELSRKSRGFNLVEIAIVLGIVGLVIGGIWIAAAVINKNVRVNRAVLEADDIIRGLNLLYDGKPLPDAIVTYDSLLINAGAVKSDMVQGAGIKNPWGGSVIVSTPYSVGSIVRIMFMGVAKTDCSDFVIKTVGAVDVNGLGRNGLYTMVINGTIVSPALLSSSGFSTFLTSVNARCTASSAALINLEYLFPDPK